MPDINQGIFYEKFIRFMELDRGISFSDDQKSEMLERFSEGLCHGFSVTHSYMAATNNLQWWKKALEKMSEWDPETMPLDLRVTLPGSRAADGETLKSLFKRIINYVLYNHGDYQSGVSGASQREILKKGGYFISEKGSIFHRVAMTGHMDSSVLENILKPEIFKQEAVFLMHSTDHTCSIRFKNNNWYFYNPRFPHGEKSFENVADLIREIHLSLGKIISIEIASWIPEIVLDEFISTRENMVVHNGLSLDKSAVFFEMVRASPDQLDLFISLSEKYNEMRQFLVRLLGVVDIQYLSNNLQSIIQFAPESFSRIVSLAQKHDDLYQSMIAALKNKNIYQWTGFNLVTKYAPRELEYFFTCAESDESVRKIIAESLENKNKSGVTGLQLIAEFALDQIEKIILLAKMDENIQQSLINSLTEDSPKNRDILSKVEQVMPVEHEWISLRINELRDLALLKKRICGMISAFVQKTSWVVEQGNLQLFKPISTEGKDVCLLLAKIADSKNKDEIVEHLKTGKLDGREQYNERLDTCIRLVSGSTPGMRM